jgi:uncharacterized DUF497 family protein
MAVEFHPAKDAANIAKHGVSLARAEEMDLGDALVLRSDRNEETRFIAYGRLADEALFALVFTVRGTSVRAISLRPMKAKEKRLFLGDSDDPR